MYMYTIQATHRLPVAFTLKFLSTPPTQNTHTHRLYVSMSKTNTDAK